MKMIISRQLGGLARILLVMVWAVQAHAAAPPPTPQQIEADWLRQDAVRGLRGNAVEPVVQRGLRLAASLRSLRAAVDAEAKTLEQAAARWKALPRDASDDARRKVYFQAHWAVRKMALANPLLDFKDLLLATSAPGRWSHMADQYLGWWSQPGGGLYVFLDFNSGRPKLRPLIAGFPPGNVLRPELDFDAKKVLFAWCRYYPGLSEQADKLDKAKLPEDSFYHLFEVNLDGSGLRQLTHGKYNDFDGRYLPDGRIVFCSTRRGQALQCTQETAAATLEHDALPECYVRCGGGPSRPCAVYTLHVMDSGGGSLRPISAFEMFEWTPSIDEQGRILYSRWDYVDRYGQNAMGLWSTHPDGTGARALFGNYSRNPECIFEARTVPGSPRLVFTASAHHSITAGSLVLLDPRLGPDAPEALTRLTPEVPFPESEGIPKTYYANPYPLSEDYFLVAWSDRPLKGESYGGANHIAALGVYLYDVFGNLELLYRDPAIGSQYPLAIRPRRRPPQVSDQVAWDGPQQAQMLLLDVYQGLESVPRGTIKRLRVVGMPVKTHPSMNYPTIVLTTHDAGRFVLGTVPVEPDGSAFFRVPSGITLFVQALDAEGMAVQTMRSGTYLQPGQTYSCIGCHEHRTTAPPNHMPRAAARGPSNLTPGPDGSWPLDYATLVQGLLDRQCVACHKPGTKGQKFDLTPAQSYAALTGYGSPSLKDIVIARYREQRSKAGQCEARMNPVLKLLERGHYGVKLSADDRDRLVTWMDTLGQRAGHFSPEQEQQLRELRRHMASLLEK
jgi:cytochrome c553